MKEVEALLSYGQLKQSLRSLRLSFTGYPEPATTFDDDGFLHYPKWERQIALGTFTPNYEGSKTEYTNRFFRFTAIDNARRERFEGLLEYAHSHNIAVRAFLTPLSGPLIEHLRIHRSFDSLHQLVWTYLQEVQARHPHFSVVDFTDVRSFGGNPAGFLDGAHTDDENSRRLVEALYRAPSSKTQGR
jgi:hypothetical protein